MNKKSRKRQRKSRTMRRIGNRRYSGSLGRFDKPYCPDGSSYIAESDAKIVGKLEDNEKLCVKDGINYAYYLMQVDKKDNQVNFVEWWKGYDRNGYDKDGYNIYNRDRQLYDRDGLDIDGFNRYGLDWKGRDRNGYGRDGYDEYGYDRYGRNKEGWNRYGYNREGYDRYGRDKYGRQKPK